MCRFRFTDAVREGVTPLRYKNVLFFCPKPFEVGAPQAQCRAILIVTIVIVFVYFDICAGQSFITRLCSVDRPEADQCSEAE